ncbi:MAG TPA: NUDIX domain-containing protein [Candidatus Paceibacterota bacterium]
MSIYNKAVPSVYLFLQFGDKWLLGQRKNTGYWDGKWSTPSGHVKDGELPSQAVIREAREELGIEVLECDLEMVHVSYRSRHDEKSKGSRADYFFKARVWAGEIKNAEPHKCEQVKWIDTEWVSPMVPSHVGHAFECAQKQKGVSYSELGSDFLKKNGVWTSD